MGKMAILKAVFNLRLSNFKSEKLIYVDWHFGMIHCGLLDRYSDRSRVFAKIQEN